MAEVVRYSDEELQEFKALIEEKIAKARKDMQAHGNTAFCVCRKQNGSCGVQRGTLP